MDKKIDKMELVIKAKKSHACSNPLVYTFKKMDKPLDGVSRVFCNGKAIGWATTKAFASKHLSQKLQEKSFRPYPRAMMSFIGLEAELLFVYELLQIPAFRRSNALLSRFPSMKSEINRVRIVAVSLSASDFLSKSDLERHAEALAFWTRTPKQREIVAWGEAGHRFAYIQSLDGVTKVVKGKVLETLRWNQDYGYKEMLIDSFEPEIVDADLILKRTQESGRCEVLLADGTIQTLPLSDWKLLSLATKFGDIERAKGHKK